MLPKRQNSRADCLRRRPFRRVRQRYQGFADLYRVIAGSFKREPVDAFANTQVETFAVDPDEARCLVLGQTGERDVVSDGLGMVLIHVLDHAGLYLPSEGIDEFDTIEPVDGTKATDIAMPYRFKVPEIEIMCLMIILRLGEVAIVTLRCGFYRLRGFKPPSLSHHRQTAHCLNIFSSTLAHQNGTTRVEFQVMGVLSDPADEEQRPSLGVQAIRHNRAERITRHGLGVRGQDTTVFL